MVVPHEGTWIEIVNIGICSISYFVVPHEGTWIEIINAGLKVLSC